MSYSGTKPGYHDTWPVRQAVHDLSAVATCSLSECGKAMDFARPFLSGDEPSGDANIEALLKLEEIAFDPPSPEAVCAAIAILMREHLAQRMEFSVPPDVWFMIDGAIQAAPFARRAVLRRSVGVAADATYSWTPNEWAERGADPVQNFEPIPDEILRTVLRDLRAAASRLEPTSIHAISLADYGWRADEHAEALTALVEAGDFTLTRDMYWAPSEVIELTAHDPAKGGFFTCAAILMITELSGSIMDYMEFRWGANAPAFLANDSPLGETLLRGFRLLFEGDYPFYSMQWHEKDGSRCEMIPYFDEWHF